MPDVKAGGPVVANAAGFPAKEIEPSLFANL
jgi:hypothetical protein